MVSCGIVGGLDRAEQPGGTSTGWRTWAGTSIQPAVESACTTGRCMYRLSQFFQRSSLETFTENRLFSARFGSIQSFKVTTEIITTKELRMLRQPTQGLAQTGLCRLLVRALMLVLCTVLTVPRQQCTAVEVVRRCEQATKISPFSVASLFFS